MSIMATIILLHAGYLAAILIDLLQESKRFQENVRLKPDEYDVKSWSYGIYLGDHKGRLTITYLLMWCVFSGIFYIAPEELTKTGLFFLGYGTENAANNLISRKM